MTIDTNRLRTKLHRPISYRARLLACFIVATMAPMLLTILISGNVSMRRLREQLDISYSMTLRVVETNIEKRTAQMEQVVSDIAREPLMLAHFSKPTGQNGYERILDIQEINASLKLRKESFSLHDIRVYVPDPDERGMFFYSRDELADMEGLTGEASAFWRYTYPFDYVAKALPRDKSRHWIFSRVQVIKNLIDSQQYSVCFVDILEEELYTYIEELDQTDGVWAFLLDPLGNMVSCAEKTMLGEPCGLEYLERLAGDEGSFVWRDHMIVYRTNAHNGLTLVSDIPLAKIYAQTMGIQNVTLGMCVLGLLLAVLLASVFSRRLSRKVNLLLSAMSEPGTAARLPQPISPFTPSDWDELDKLILAYNDMSGHLNSLMKEISRTRIRESDLRLKLLRAQIDPHFFYNMLDSLRSLIVSGRQAEAERLTMLLAGFYRTALNRGYDLIAVRDELSMAETYFELQRLCYGDDIKLEICVEPPALDAKIVGFTLQPIIENAIKHGLRQSGRGGTVRITGSLESNILRLRVADDGVGMNQDTLDALRREAMGSVDSMRKGYGVYNVSERLRLNCPNGYAIEIDSEPAVGTRVSITIPLKEEQS